MNPMIVHGAPPINELSATSAAAGFPLAFLVDWRSYTWWQSVDNGAQVINWAPLIGTVVSDFLLDKHNLSSVGASVTLEGSDDDFASDVTVIIATEFVANDAVFYRRFAPVNKVRYRLVIASQSAAVKIGMLSLGEAFVFERGIAGEYAPISRSQKSEVAVASGGALLGVAVSHISTATNVSIPYVGDGWYRAVYEPFWLARLAGKVPFYWLHNYAAAPGDIYLMRVADDQFNAPYQAGGFRHLTLDLVGS